MRTHYNYHDGGRRHDRHERYHHGPVGHGIRPPLGPYGHAQVAAGMAGRGRARRGDVRTAVLRLLTEQPMHGYQIIQELSQRSGGVWNPGAGSVYPTLQMLADEGLVISRESDSKKVFSLTEAGRTAAAEKAHEPAPWDQTAKGGPGSGAYRNAAGKLMQAIWQVGTGGSSTQIEAATEVVSEARKKLYAILAED